jgi:hypothetical protein
VSQEGCTAPACPTSPSAQHSPHYTTPTPLPPPNCAGLGGYAIAYPFLGTPWKHTVASLQAHPVLNAIVKFGVAFPFAYHFFGGLRHLAWDNILFHNPVSARTSGIAAIAVGVAGGVVGALYESSE